MIGHDLNQLTRANNTVWNNSTRTGSPALEQKFVYDGWNLLAILSPNSQLLSSFVWGLDLSGSLQGAGGVGGLLAVNDAANGVHFCAYDGNGNVTALVKATDGTVSANYEYGPFGEVIRISGAMAKSNPFRFSTKYQDEETDMLYYGYRSYNPSTGRWLNREPLSDRAFFTFHTKGKSGNEIKQFRFEALKPLYVFANNDPVKNFDSDGRFTITIPPITWPAAIGIGLGYCLDNLSCRARVRLALSNGESEADRIAPDESTHRGANAVEGGDADALTHCIAACNLGHSPYPCFGPDGALDRLQARETGNDLGTQLDRLNNEVGIGLGISLGAGENCNGTCLNALRRGLLNEIQNGRIVPSSVQ